MKFTYNRAPIFYKNKLFINLIIKSYIMKHTKKAWSEYFQKINDIKNE